MLNENSTGEVAVNMLVFILITIEHYVFNDNVVHIFCGEDGEDSVRISP